MQILHTDELGPTVYPCRILHLQQLVGKHRTGTNISHLPTLHHIMQRLHCLLDWGQGIESMDLKKIDIIQLQALQTRIHGIKDMFPAQPKSINISLPFPVIKLPAQGILEIVSVSVAHGRPQFSCNDDILTTPIVLANCFAEDLF